MRMVKSEEEIKYIKDVIRTTKGGNEIMRSIRPGMYEYQVEAYLIYLQYTGNLTLHLQLSLQENATILHYDKIIV